MQTLIERADAFAAAAHARVVNKDGSIGHRRRYTGEPYILHPREVASILARHGRPPEEIAAALLHDTIEDTDVTYEEIRDLFGIVVAGHVLDVTDVPKEAGNAMEREAMNLERLEQAGVGGQNVKCADYISNTKSIALYDPGFAQTYLKKKEAGLNLMRRADPALLVEAWEALRAGQHMLVQHNLAAKPHPGAG